MKVSGRKVALVVLCVSFGIAFAAFVSIRFVKDWLPLPRTVPAASQVTAGDLAEVVRKVEQYGATSEVEAALSLAARRFASPGIYLVKDNQDGPGGFPQGPVEVAYPPELVGSDSMTALARLREIEQNRWGGYAAGEKARATAPDGTRYAIVVAWGSRAPSIAVAIGYTFFAALLLAWLSMAAWVYFDARHAGGVALGWGLLTLISGPLALAVWLIYRRNHQQRPVCAGCGKDQIPDALYCPYCGQPSRPACPECHRAVETDWTYCAACGTDLTDEGVGVSPSMGVKTR